MTTPASAPTITVATFNYEQGGWADGRLHIQPTIDHIAETVPQLDILTFQEAKHYQRDGGQALHEFAELLGSRLGGTWGSHLARNPISPLHNCIFYRHSTARPVQAWSDPRDPDARHTYAGSLWLRIDGLPKPLLVMSVHWRHYSGAVRAEEAGKLGNMIVLPTIIAGDFNCLWPSQNEPRPNWEELPPHLRYHKTKFDMETGKLDTDLDAGWISSRQGWVDAGALAQDGTVTSNNPPDRAPCRIDRIMVSPPLAAGARPRQLHRPHPRRARQRPPARVRANQPVPLRRALPRTVVGRPVRRLDPGRRRRLKRAQRSPRLAAGRGSRVTQYTPTPRAARSLGAPWPRHCRSRPNPDPPTPRAATCGQPCPSSPNIDDTFTEVETIVHNDEEVPTALGAERTVLAGLGVSEVDLTTELYIDAVAVAGPA